MYNTYLDQLEFADSVGFDGIGCNEHHQNGYGLMPSPNLIAATLARRTSKSAICVIGNSIAGCTTRRTASPRSSRCSTASPVAVSSPASRSARRWTPTSACGQIPALTRDKYAEAHDLIIQAWTRERPFAFDGKYNQLRYVNTWPQAGPEAAPADLHPRWRLDRDVGLLPRPRLQLQLPVVLRVQGRQGAARRVLGTARRARRRRREPVPGELRPDHRRRRHRRRGREALRRAHPVLLQQLPARPPRLRRPARLPHDQHHQGRQAEPVPPGGVGHLPEAHVDATSSTTGW